MGVKLKDIVKAIKAGAQIGSLVTGGKAKSVLDIVNTTISSDRDPANEQALRDLALVNDAQTEVLTDHEARLRRLEQQK